MTTTIRHFKGETYVLIKAIDGAEVERFYLDSSAVDKKISELLNKKAEIYQFPELEKAS